ncbi:hypothetical protein [Pseudoprevotella muciniphila]|nr:hypothetical protein [Pseudoprevotella muciniphila]
MNNKNISKEQIINKAIQNAINEFLKSLEKRNSGSARIDGEIPDVREYIKTFDNINSYDIYNTMIDEGLIKTYPIDKTINYIVRKYGLDNRQVRVSPINNGIVDVDIITIILRNTIDSNTLGDIKHDFQTCGYFNNQKPTQIHNTNYLFFCFEPKFSQDVTTMVRQNYRYLYHSSPKIFQDKVMRCGLIPKSKNTLFLYPDRTFLMVGDNLNSQQINVLKNVQTERNSNCNTLNQKETKEHILITIDVSKIPQDVKFYCDPLSHRAIFTNDNIPRHSIVNVEPFTL